MGKFGALGLELADTHCPDVFGRDYNGDDDTYNQLIELAILFGLLAYSNTRARMLILEC